MKLKNILLTITVLLILSSVLFSNQLGLGIILGAPTGFSLKYWQSTKSAFDLALAWNFDDGYFHIHGDYLYHFPLGLEGVPRSTLFTYIGIGARIIFDRDSNGNDSSNVLGIRGVGGIEFLPQEIPLDLFLEVAPVMNITETEFDFEGGLGIRYNFSL